jgi:hypothetical protein
MPNSRSTGDRSVALPAKCESACHSLHGGRHVYADVAWLLGQRLCDKVVVHVSPAPALHLIRFVAGKLDPLETRSEFLDLAGRSPVRILMVYGAQTPLRSRAEMEALAERLCSLEIDGQLDFDRELDRKLAGFVPRKIARPYPYRASFALGRA